MCRDHCGRSATIGASLAVALLSACGDPAGTDRPTPAGLRASLGVQASIQATTATAIELRPGYLRAGGVRVELGSPSRVSLTAGASQAATTGVELGACLGDAQRAVAAAADECEVELELRLLRAETVLDRQTVRVRVRPGDARVVDAPIALREVTAVRVVATGAGAATSQVEVGDTLRLVATAVDTTGATVAGRAATWESLNAGVARVDANGLVTGVAVGTVTVRASSGGRAGQMSVTVAGPSVRTLTAVPTTVQLEVGDSRVLAITARDVAGNVLDGRPVAFTSANAAVATVRSDGTVVGVAAGSTVVTASSTQGPNGTVVRVDVPVTVTASAVASFRITFPVPTPLQLPAGTSITLTIQTLDARGTVLTGRPFTTSSTDPAVATLGTDGVLRAIGVGSATLTVSTVATATGAPVTATIPVTVTSAGPTGTITGRVYVGVTSAPVAGATLTFVRAGATVATAISATDGTWTTPAIPQGTYTIGISSPTTLSTMVSLVAVTGPTTVPAIPLTLNNVSTGVVQGTVRSATTGQLLTVPVTLTIVNGVALTSAAVDQLGGSTVSVSSGGVFTLPSVVNTVTIRARATGFGDALVFAAPAANQPISVNLALTPTGGTAGLVRIVLTWGANPVDLDSYLAGPTGLSTGRFLVFWNAPGNCLATPFACLDVDDTNGFGPETITIVQQNAGVYRYAVNRFFGVGTIATSGVRVDVYNASGQLLITFTPPAGVGDWWNVFELSNGLITPINTVGSGPPAVVFGPGAAVRPSKGSLRRQP